MYSKLWLVAFSFMIALMLSNNHGRSSYHQSHEKGQKKISCSPDWNYLNEWMEENEIPVIPGAGSHKWKISTKNDSAQFYFNQGINMYYSFHLIEAMAS